MVQIWIICVTRLKNICHSSRHCIHLDQITDRSERFLASEIIREKIMRQLGEELPYDLTVQIESFKTEEATFNPKTGRPESSLYLY